MRHHRPLIIAGVVATVCYAAWAAWQILVLNPLAAAPGRTLPEIQAELARYNESLGEVAVAVILGAGVVIALGLAKVHWNGNTRWTAASYLLLLALGTPAYWVASFGAGMALADTFGIGGADHSPWALPLYAVSAVTAVGFVLVAVVPWPKRSSQGPTPGGAPLASPA